MKTLSTKIVAITGAGSGIGRALAVQCAELGASLAISDVNEAGLEETASLARPKSTGRSTAHAWTSVSATPSTPGPSR